MDTQRATNAVLVVAVVLAGAVVAVDLAPLDPPWTEDREAATVTVVDETGTSLATVEVEVADTSQERYVGLSDHEALANGSGMLFVHDREAPQTYVMREMDFPIDIVFVDADRRVTKVVSAPAPGPNESGNTIRRSGRAKYVLEVPRGYANATGIAPGDRLRIEYVTATPTAGLAPAAGMEETLAGLAEREGWRVEDYAARVHYEGAGDRYSVEYYEPSACVLYWRVKGDGETAVPVGRETVPEPLRERIRGDLADAGVDPAIEDREL